MTASRTTTAFWMFAAFDGTVGLLMLHFGHPGIAAINLLALAALSWAGYLSEQNDRHRATQDRDYLKAVEVRAKSDTI